MVKEWGTDAFLVASIAFGLFTVLFMVGVRWWTDLLGRTIAAVCGSIAAIMLVADTRTLGLSIPDYMLVRAILFTVFACVMVGAVGIFVYVQFLSPRIHRRNR